MALVYELFGEDFSGFKRSSCTTYPVNIVQIAMRDALTAVGSLHQAGYCLVGMQSRMDSRLLVDNS